MAIFLRELRDIWEKANPEPTVLKIIAAERLGILKKKMAEKEALEQLRIFWKKNQMEGQSFVNFETALFRMDKDFRKKSKRDRLFD